MAVIATVVTAMATLKVVASREAATATPAVAEVATEEAVEIMAVVEVDTVAVVVTVVAAATSRSRKEATKAKVTATVGRALAAAAATEVADQVAHLSVTKKTQSLWVVWENAANPMSNKFSCKTTCNHCASAY